MNDETRTEEIVTPNGILHEDPADGAAAPPSPNGSSVAAPERPARAAGATRVLALATLFSLVVGFAGGLGGYLWGPEIADTLGIEQLDRQAEQAAPADDAPQSLPPEIEGSKGTADSGELERGNLTVATIYARAAPAVVHIDATVEGTDIWGLPQEGNATGSGFVISDDGHIVTNAHVVSDATDITVSFEDEKRLDAELVGIDVSTDTAVLKLVKPRENLTVLRFADSSQLRVGDPVVAIGNPYGLDRTATVGIVSALQREIPAPNGFKIADVIQTDAAINPGNSGGPLFNMRGEVIGTNSQIASSSGANAGIAFAVPSNTVERITSDLINDGDVERAWLGVQGLDVNAEIADAFNLAVEQGVLVDRVFDDSPAQKAGIEAGETEIQINGETVHLGGDILVSFDGRKLTSMEQLFGLVEKSEPGDTVEIVYYRGDDRRTVEVKLGNRPDDDASRG